MRLGVTIFVTDQSIGIAEVARATEERGLASLFLPEHTHIPARRTTPAPMGGPLPEQYRRIIDPFVGLATAAAVTERIQVGTGICLVAQRDPFVLAKEIATLDYISGGRFQFGIGFGWNREELEDHGVAFADRRSVVRERILAMQRLWADDDAAFAGEHVAFEAAWSWPKPVQRPWPPVLIGGAAGPILFRHVAEYADGWFPIGGGGVRAALPDLHRAAEEAGRDPSSLVVVPFAVTPDLGRLEYYASIGIEHTVLQLPSGSADEVLPVLDLCGSLVEKVA